MEWTSDEVHEAKAARDAVQPREHLRGGGIFVSEGDALRAVMSRAVSLFLARASGQAKADVAELESTIESAMGFDDATRAEDRQRLSRLSALAQEAESLRAKVAGLEEQRNLLGKAASDFGDDLRDARAEVERLKARAERLEIALSDRSRSYQQALTQAQAAESSLAAIRERAAALECDPAERVNLRWVLEGYAPNSPGIPDGSGEARCQHENPTFTPNGCGQCIAERPQDARPACVCRLGHNLPCYAGHHPCSATCTHDDAATLGHPQRVKSMSAVFRRAMAQESGATEPQSDGQSVEVARLTAQVERLQIDISGHVGTIHEQHATITALQEQLARLTAAGQVLSEHVDRTAGARLTDEELARNAIGGPLAASSATFVPNATMAKDVLSVSPRIKTILSAGERVHAVEGALPLDHLVVIRRDGAEWAVARKNVILDADVTAGEPAEDAP